MAHDTQSLKEKFSNEKSNDSCFWSGYPETPKINKKTYYQSESLCNACYADGRKVIFFFKNE